MKISGKRDKYFILAFLIIFGFITLEPSFYVWYDRREHKQYIIKYKIQIEYLSTCLLSYIEQTKGGFPSNEEEFLDKIKIDESKIPDFECFYIYYGFKFGHTYEIINGKLINVHDEEQVLIIDGPLKRFLKDEYKKASLNIYQKMLSYSNQDKENNITNNNSTEQHNILKRLTSNLKNRRTWKITQVKIWLNNPSIVITFKQPNSKQINIHAWPENQNDFNVPMMRLDFGEDLYKLTENEYEELNRMNKKVR